MQMFEPIANLGPFWVFVINTVCLIVGGLLAIKVIMVFLEHALKKGGHVDDSIHTFILSAVKAVCGIILLTMILQNFGVHMTTIIAVLGAAGAAIALALKDSLANIAGGVMIIYNHPFNKGDLISVGENRGKVENIDLFLTTITTLDNKTVTIPNGILNTSVIYNETSSDTRRIECTFSIGYDTDIDKAKQILRNICLAGPLVLDDPEPIIGISAHGDSGLVLGLFAYCKTDKLIDAKYYLYETAKKAFEENNIEIPYPHMDVNLHN